MMAAREDLSYDVAHVYKTLEKRGVTAPIAASVSISGDITVHQNLAAGQRLTVSVHGPDGEVVGHAIVVASPPAFVPVDVKDLGVVGMERKHKLKIHHHADPNQMELGS